MKTLRAAWLGLEGAASTPWMVLGFWLANLLVALPAGVLVADAIGRDLDASAVQEELLQGFDTAWHSEFQGRTSGLANTLTPARVVGLGPLLDNLEGWALGQIFQLPPGAVALGLVFALLWSFLLAGAVTRFADPWRPGGLGAFFQGAGRSWGRFLRLALITAPAYVLIYRLYRRLLKVIEDATNDVTRETTVLAWVLAATLLTVLLLAILRSASDYAKAALVLEPRRSSFLAAFAGLRFVLRYPLRTLGLALLFALLFLLLVATYGWLAPGTGQSTWAGVILALAVGQLYLIARIALRLALLAGETALFRDLRRL